MTEPVELMLEEFTVAAESLRNKKQAEETFQEEFGEALIAAESMGDKNQAEETFQEKFGEARESLESEELCRTLDRAEETSQEEFGKTHESSESEELGRTPERADETFQEELGVTHESLESEEFGGILFDMSLEADELVNRRNFAISFSCSMLSSLQRPSHILFFDPKSILAACFKPSHKLLCRSSTVSSSCPLREC